MNVSVSFFSSAAMKAADERAVSRLAMPSAILMENAGRGAAEAIVAAYPQARRVIFVCGRGNNGGDGFVAARHLSAMGLDVTAILASADEIKSPDAITAQASCRASGCRVVVSEKESDEDLVSMIESHEVVVDAMLGTGSSGEPRGEVLRMLEIIAGSECGPIVSLDVPSGVAPDSGVAHEFAVYADMTLTFLAPKIGLAIAPGSLHAGRIEVVGLGTSRSAMLDDAQREIEGYSFDDIEDLAPITPPDIHKGSRGGLLIVGGSAAYRGAPILAARAALRSGCGMLFLAVPDFVAPTVSSTLPEAVILPLKTNSDGLVSPGVLEDAFSPYFSKIDACVIGPGIGRSSEAEVMVRHALGHLKRWKRPLLIDADALFHLAHLSRDENIEADPLLVITPHEGEAARLLDTSPAEVASRRLRSARELSRRFGVALLKGPRTIVASEGSTRVVLDGGPELAVPGSGDVLSGVIGALLARGLSPDHAALLGALVHARAGASIGRTDGVLAGEIADALRF